MSNGRIDKSVKSASLGVARQVSNIILNFAVKTVFIWTLGQELLGVNAVFKEIVSVFSVADLGIGTVLIYSMYEPISRSDKERLGALIHFYKKIYFYIAMAIAALGIIFLPFIRYVINLKSDMPHIYWYYLLFLSNTVISYLTVYKLSILEADQKAWIIHKYEMIIVWIGTVLQLIFLVAAHNYIIFLIIQNLITFFVNYSVGEYAKKDYPEILTHRSKLSREEQQGIFQNVKYMFVYKMSYALVNSTDNMLISVLIGTISAGIYSNYLLLSHAAVSIISVIIKSVTASIGNLIYTEKKEKARSIFYDLQIVCLILALICCICYSLLFDDVINVWLGDDFLLGKEIAILISANLYFSIIMKPVWAFRDASGMYDSIKFVMPCYALFNIVFSLLFAKLFGMAGILLATLLSGLVTVFIREPKLVFQKLLGNGVSKFYKNIGINVLVTGISVILLRYLFANFSVDGILDLLIKVALVFVYSVIMAWVIYGRTDIVKRLSGKKKWGNGKTKL